MQGIHRHIHTSHFFYKANRVPDELMVPREVLIPIAHHKVWPLRGFYKTKYTRYITKNVFFHRDLYTKNDEHLLFIDFYSREVRTLI